MILQENKILPDYSYKNYSISPFSDYYIAEYTMPFNLGEKWDVLYSSNTLERIVLENKIITDTIRSEYSRRETETVDTEEQYLIPVFEDGSWHTGLPDKMFFLKGMKMNISDFNAYGPDYRVDISNLTEKGNQTQEHYRLTVDGDIYFLQELYTKIREEEVKMEVSYSDKSVKQILFKTTLTLKNEPANFDIAFMNDLDGDGKLDFIFRIGYTITHENTYCNVASFVLFLSSEAEGDALLKHVATKTIVGEPRKLLYR